MSTKHKFRISSALKDIIGRDLITNDFVAIFELVKNSFDAGAKHVRVLFADDLIVIVDDGKGMSRSDILSKWLFVAYSAKKTGEEDPENSARDYRDEISARRGYAGNKGIGRFSCDRLGKQLRLYSRTKDNPSVEMLSIDWEDFEKDSKTEFATVAVDLASGGAFPKFDKLPPLRSSGTILVIDKLRDDWPQDKIRRLRADLAKLVDPFETTREASIETFVVGQSWPDVEGQVGNKLLDLLNEKTTRISVEIADGIITSKLFDRGQSIYHIRESSPYEELLGASVKADMYFLNRSAKHTFTNRMGVQPVSFGNLFLFVNGFRIFPVGEPTDDTFGIGRRKQQGHSRYLGLRDILGKIDVRAPPNRFREASSRDAGLIGKEAIDLYDAIIKHVLVRLERYVVGVTWADQFDTDRDTVEGLRSDAGRTRIIKLIRALVGARDVTLVDYNRDLIDIVNERSADFEDAMTGLALVAEQTGDRSLLARVERSRKRFQELKTSEEQAREVAEAEIEARRSAEARAVVAEERVSQATQRLQRVEEQTRLLVGLQGRGNEELTLLHHQVIIYATEVQALVRRGLKRLSHAKPPFEQVAADLEQIAFQNSRILAVTRFATQANFRLRANTIEADVVQFLKEYVQEVAKLYEGSEFVRFVGNGLSSTMDFKPIDVSIVIDNLISNARAAKATSISFECRKPQTGRGIEIVVVDNGRGIDDRVVDPTKIFDKGYSSTRGSGLGLYHVRQVLEDLGGAITLDPERSGSAAQFVIRLPAGKKQNETPV